MENNILVTGSHRSGTTWVGKTIAQSSCVRYVQEPFNVKFPNKYMELGVDKWFLDYAYATEDEQLTIKRAFDHLFHCSSIEHAVKCFNSSPVEWKSGFRFIRDLCLESYYKPRVLVKDPLALFSAEWLYNEYNLKTLCMIRNPLAFVGSLKKVNWDFDFDDFFSQNGLVNERLGKYCNDINTVPYNGDFIERSAFLWNILHYVIYQYKKKHNDWLFVIYEDLASNPLKGFDEIFSYLGLDFNENIKKYVEAHTSSSNPTDPAISGYQPRNSEASIDTWKDRLSNDECRKVIEATCEIGIEFYPELYR